MHYFQSQQPIWSNNIHTCTHTYTDRYNTPCPHDFLDVDTLMPSKSRTFDFILHFIYVIHQDWAREECLPIRSSICLELTTFIHHQQRLSDNLQISVENLLFPFIILLQRTRLISSHSRQRLWSYYVMALYKSIYYYYNYYILLLPAVLIRVFFTLYHFLAFSCS